MEGGKLVDILHSFMQVEEGEVKKQRREDLTIYHLTYYRMSFG